MNVRALRDAFEYDAETGVFTRRNSGRRAGTINTGGYVVISVCNKLEYAHRMAWAFVHGRSPSDSIDHINGCRSDNRICNLREASNQQNQFNRKVRRDSSSGVKGVRFHNLSGLWHARIVISRKVVSLGYYKTRNEAKAAYAAAASRLFGEFARAA